MGQRQNRKNGNLSGSRNQQRPVTGGVTKRNGSGYVNDGNKRITTTSQGTDGTPPKQGK